MVSWDQPLKSVFFLQFDSRICHLRMCWGCLGKGFPPANWEMWTSPCREIGGCRRLRGKLTSWRCRYVLFKMMNMGIFYGHVNLFEGYVIHWFSFSRMLWKNSCINTVYLEMPTRHYSTWQKTSCIVDTFIYIYVYFLFAKYIYICDAVIANMVCWAMRLATHEHGYFWKKAPSSPTMFSLLVLVFGTC